MPLASGVRLHGLGSRVARVQGLGCGTWIQHLKYGHLEHSKGSILYRAQTVFSGRICLHLECLLRVSDRTFTHCASILNLLQ